MGSSSWWSRVVFCSAVGSGFVTSPRLSPSRGGLCVVSSSSEEVEAESQTLAGLESEYWNSLSRTEQTILAKSRAGGEYLKLGQLEEALACFDVAQDLSQHTRYEWHRGLALFYLGRDADAAADLVANAQRFEERFEEPATEERIFAAAAARRATAAATAETKARRPPIVVESPLRETRPVLRAARDLFFAGAGEAPTMAWTAKELQAACRARGLKVSGKKADLVVRLAEGAPTTEPGLDEEAARTKAFDALRGLCTDRNGDPLRRKLFAHFYAGLYHEAENDRDRAAAHLAIAAQRAETDPTGDLTAVLPKIHADARGWTLADVSGADLKRALAFE